VRDLARVGQLMLTGGHRGGRQIIPNAWLDDIAGNGDRQAWQQGEFAAGFGGRDMSYRSGWYVINDGPKTLFAMGIHGQNLFVDQANRIVIAKLSSQHAPIDPGALALTHRAVAEVRRCLSGA
jgi:CubicO group peptidase (beta-lactamase class C family)